MRKWESRSLNLRSSRFMKSRYRSVWQVGFLFPLGVVLATVLIETSAAYSFGMGHSFQDLSCLKWKVRATQPVLIRLYRENPDHAIRLLNEISVKAGISSHVFLDFTGSPVLLRYRYQIVWVDSRGNEHVIGESNGRNQDVSNVPGVPTESPVTPGDLCRVVSAYLTEPTTSSPGHSKLDVLEIFVGPDPPVPRNSVPASSRL